jgi:crotonobetainyl-CoA:carnitine CoA-transferase CaiB-like acyl-CoA transferase
VTLPLEGCRVVELGERIGAGVCGSFLAQLGADVFFVEPLATPDGHKWRHRALMAAGKRSFLPERSADAVRDADVVITCSDVDSAERQALAALSGGQSILCDITAFGSDGPMAGKPCTDGMIQAASGFMSITGQRDGAPSVSAVPLLENAAGLYAASAVMAALRARIGQRVEVALFDCALNGLTTSLPACFDGRVPGRLGNGHALTGPWNSYRTRDGFIQVCCATERQWQQLCKVIERPDLGGNPEFATLAQRMAQREMIDAAVTAWTMQRDSREAVERLNGGGVACGEVLSVRDIASEPNLMHRRMVVESRDPVSGKTIYVPGSPIRGDLWSGRTPADIPPVAEGSATPAPRSDRWIGPATPQAPYPPLQGIRVLEIGQFTTAPVTAKVLASLGAEVIKIEPPGGEAAREWAPHRHGTGYFFTLNNSGKTSVEIDLAGDTGKVAFRELIRTADILVENMKPGSLAQLGFPLSVLSDLNAGLIYCPISGYGHDSAYASRPAYDTVIQAMCGIMDMTRDETGPVKCGPSVCDISGGQLGIVAILAALLYRDRTRQGTALDLSMQDIGAWFSQTGWNGPVAMPGRSIGCADGYVYVEPADAAVPPCDGMTVKACLAELARAGIDAVPVATVNDAAGSAQVAARNMIFESTPIDGKTWPLLGSPMRLSRTPPVIRDATPDPRPLDDETRALLGIR